MANPKVYFIHLRRPRSIHAAPNEQRDDPFYEFGSFGCTGRHSANLFHPRHADEIAGSMLAFVQGGAAGFRLVFLTPPITVRKWADRCEARWTPAEMPFKYADAPILAWNNGQSDFPLVEKFARETARTTVEGGLSSKIRTLALPLATALADEVVSTYETFRDTASPLAIASTYDEALPFAPPRIDRRRKGTYRQLVSELSVGTGNRTKTPKMESPQSKTIRKMRCGRARQRHSECEERRFT